MRLLVNLVSLVILLTFSQCAEDKGSSSHSQNKTEPKEKFKVRDHSLLYFRNMRLPFYDIEELVENREFIYRTASRTKNANYPLIQNAIHYDQHNSKAYIILEANRFFPEDSILIAWQDPDSKNRDEFYIRTDSPENILAASKRIAEYLSIEYDLYFRKGGGQLKLFTKKNDQKQFVTVTNDFINFTSP